MTTNAKLVHIIADALIGAHGQDVTEGLECGSRAAIVRVRGIARRDCENRLD